MNVPGRGNMQRFLIYRKGNWGSRKDVICLRSYNSKPRSPNSKFKVLQCNCSLSVVVFLFILLIMGQGLIILTQADQEKREKNNGRRLCLQRARLILHAKQCTLAPTPPGLRPALLAVCSFPVGAGGEPYSCLVLALMKRHLQNIRARFRLSRRAWKECRTLAPAFPSPHVDAVPDFP